MKISIQHSVGVKIILCKKMNPLGTKSPVQKKKKEKKRSCQMNTGKLIYTCNWETIGPNKTRPNKLCFENIYNY